MERDKIETTTGADPYRRDIVLGDLTERQYKDLADVVLLSPGYHFVVTRYNGGPSSAATHIMVWRDDNEDEYVGLVGKKTAQYYDQREETERVVTRVAAKVYRKSIHFPRERK